MAREAIAVEVNKFNAGLITDTSPLTSVDNSSLDEINMVLNIDGSRHRRLGMDCGDFLEDNFISLSNPLHISTYLWENAGGTTEDFIVVHNGSQVRIFSTATEDYENNSVYVITLNIPDVFSVLSFTSIDNMLVFMPSTTVYIVSYSGSNTFSTTTSKLKIRDLFGVDDVVSGVNLNNGTDIATRPATLPTNHNYNLRNQGWGIPRPIRTETLVGSIVAEDPIQKFYENTSTTPEDRVYPSNADMVSQSLYADATDTDNPTVRKFTPDDLIKNPTGTSQAAKGYFIIDPFDRGSSRLAEHQKNQSRYPELTYPISSMTLDSTLPSKTNVVERFAGRVWYSGFSSNTLERISTTPTMSSYVLFSQVVKSPEDITNCYQENDPTSPDFPDLIDTDGGFINITDAEDINGLRTVATGILVFATNGVWHISGTSDNGFTATTYRVDKITDRGCYGPHSIVSVDGAAIYWGKDGIYAIAPNQYGDLEASRITEAKIQNLYTAISDLSKRNVKGVYDSVERKIKWLYDNFQFGPQLNNARELVFDLQLQSFSIHEIKGAAKYTIKPMDYVHVPNLDKSIAYLIVRTASGLGTRYTFGNYGYRNDDWPTKFYDWYSLDNEGEDAEAFLETSFLSGTDFQRDKQLHYITVHMRRTETGYLPDMTPINPSSNIIQIRWDWANKSKSNKWGRSFQAYRYRRPYLPVDSNDDHDDGFATTITKNKVRGVGKVLNIRFTTEPEKDFHMYGWSMVMTVDGDV